MQQPHVKPKRDGETVNNEITEEELQDKIRAWRREYGHGGYGGWASNILQVLIDHKGFVPRPQGKRGPGIGTIADEFEQALRDMAATPAEVGKANECFKMAMVFRCFYLSSHEDADDDLLDRLRRIGLPMSRSTFYRNVRKARAFLMGYFNALRIELATKTRVA